MHTVDDILKALLTSPQKKLDAIKAIIDIDAPQEATSNKEYVLFEAYRILQALVDLKDYVDTHGEDAYYRKHKDVAWDKAREVTIQVREVLECN